MKYLVTGASRGYGAAIADELLNRSHSVYEAQRKPRTSIGNWYELDLSNPASVLNLVNKINGQERILDGLVHAASQNESIELLHSAHLSLSFDLLVIQPILLTYYLNYFGRLKDDSPVVYLLDSREFKLDKLPYSVAKQSLRSAAEAFHSVYKRVKPIFFLLPDSDGASSVKVAGEIASVLEGKNSGKMFYDLR